MVSRRLGLDGNGGEVGLESPSVECESMAAAAEVLAFVRMKASGEDAKTGSRERAIVGWKAFRWKDRERGHQVRQVHQILVVAIDCSGGTTNLASEQCVVSVVHQVHQSLVVAPVE